MPQRRSRRQSWRKPAGVSVPYAGGLTPGESISTIAGEHELASARTALLFPDQIGVEPASRKALEGFCRDLVAAKRAGGNRLVVARP